MYNINMQPYVTVRLRRSTAKSKKVQTWNLVLEINNVYHNGKFTRFYESVHRSITTPIWDKSQKNNYGYYNPRRNSNGVILCESAIDQEACNFADKLRLKRLHDFELGLLYDGYEEELSEAERKRKANVVAYFKQVAENRHPNSKESQATWLLAAEKLNKFLRGKTLRFEDINLRFVNDYRSFLQTMRNEIYKNKGYVPVSSTTAARYFMFFRAVLHQAYNEGYLEVDFASKTKAIEKTVRMREAFTVDEINALAITPCRNKVLKRAALFSCLTGLRLGDIRTLTWKHIKNVNGSWRIDFVQNKTSVSDYLPISNQALELCGTQGDINEPIFPNLNKTAYFKPALNNWLQKAGITRHMTFHCFRHTFATLLLQQGTDLLTIKSMLGHTRVTTTEIYTHIVDDAKTRAADSIRINKINLRTK